MASSSIPVPVPIAVNPNAVTISRSPPMATLSLSVSPTQTTLHERFRRNSLGPAIRAPRLLRPIDKDEIRILLLENISQGAVDAFRQQGFQVDHYIKAWSEDELVQHIGQYHAVGIRSKTKITQRVVKAASKVRRSALPVFSKVSHLPP